ncbi:NUDIX hydrolase [Carboxylicivirga caseinilyticus]|uniref:NUDIX hydrolase n=1 Tax=Carboxylicivirga caseinilyticus TaxID=3417572 RepID=UPI002AA7C5AD|nr:NUDIX domain-containing protein [uncultured Carboxylicivirga sp.]MCU4162768.1 NUDIX hydrolase [Marinilabiliaceae bacterium A049]
MGEKIINLSVDCAIFGYEDGKLKSLLIKRDKEPALNQWSLPGSYVYLEETIDEAAKRILFELTGIKEVYLTQVKVFGELDRYPDRRIVSILYCALIKPELFELMAGSHAKEVNWFETDQIGELPFDHNKMINKSLSWLKEEIWRKPILHNLLPEKFPLNQLQELYQTILQEEIDNRNFRKKVINMGLVEKLQEKTKGGQQRPAFFYRLRNTV